MTDMKKKSLVSLIIFALIALLTFILVGCDSIIKIESVELISKNESKEYEIGEFDYGDFEILIHYSDETSETVKITEDMISEYDRMQFSNTGRHTVTVTYETEMHDKYTFPIEITVKRKTVVDDNGKDAVAPYLPTTEVAYNGDYQTITVQGDVPEGASIIYPNGNSFKDAGVYEISAIVKADGYETVYLNGKLTITKGRYDLSNYHVTVDYGTDKDGNPKKSFVYDELSHGVTVSGTYPSDLGTPKYYIGRAGESTATLNEGTTATDAGTYVVYTVFTGDSKNYYIDNLTLTTEFTISKKPVSEETLKNIVFSDKTEYYNGQKHYITLGNVQLPAGIGVQYLCEDGVTPFEGQINVNEDGYLVICKFFSDNPNLEIIDDKSARLKILKADYVDESKLSIGFEGNVQQLVYDGTPHVLSVFGLENKVQVKQFLINGEPVTSITEAGVYEVTAEFKPVDQNHNAVNPISATITVTPAEFFYPIYVFESIDSVYGDGSLSLEYIEQSLPVGMTTVITYSDGTSISERYSGLPTEITEVGTYIGYVSFIYNPVNYSPAQGEDTVPNTIDDAKAVLSISRRVYNAAEIITVEDVYTHFNPSEDPFDLCKFKEALPGWIIGYRVVAWEEGAQVETMAITHAGTYNYLFEFSYFDGVDYVKARSLEAELKVAGMQIRDKDYQLTYQPSYVYDGSTVHFPSAELYLPDEVSPSIKCVYSFAYYGTSDYTEIFNGDYIDLLISTEAENSSLRAGTHKFVITLAGENYEPLVSEIVISVSPKKISVSRNNWRVPANDVEVDYDGTNHVGEYITVVSREGDQRYVSYEIVETSSKQDAGLNAGTYHFKLVFCTANPEDEEDTDNYRNYVLETDNAYYFEFNYKVNSVEVTDSASLSYFPYEFKIKQIGFNVSFFAKQNVTYSLTECPLAQTYGTKVTSTTYSIPTYMTEYNYIGIGLESSFVSSGNALIDKAFTENATYLMSKDGGEAVTYESLVAAAAAISNSGKYHLFIVFNSDNVLFDGENAIHLYFNVLPLKVTTFSLYKIGSATESPINAQPVNNSFNFAAAGLSSLLSGSNKDFFNKFKGTTQFGYTTAVDGNYIDCSQFLLSDDSTLSKVYNNKSYLVCIGSAGNILSDNNGNTVFEFNLNTDLLSREFLSGVHYIEAGTYYVFIDLGDNTVFNSTDRHTLVLSVTVTPYEVSTADVFTLKDSVGNTRTLSSLNRKYITEANKVHFPYGASNQAVIGADNVMGQTSFSGATVYSYEEIYDGKHLMLEFLGGVPDAIRGDVKLDILYASYELSDGGATVGRNYSLFGLTLTDADNLNDVFAQELYATASAKQNGITGVGIYYLFVTLRSDNINMGGVTRFVINLKVDRKNDASLFKYSFGGNQYDIRYGALPETVVYLTPAKTVYEYTVSDEIRAKLTALGITDITLTNHSVTVTNPDASGVVGNHEFTVTVKMNADEFGSYTAQTKSTFKLSKRIINFSDLPALSSATYLYTGAYIDVQSSKNQWRTEVYNGLLYLGVDASTATEMVNNDVLSFNAFDYAGSSINTLAYNAGTYYVYPQFWMFDARTSFKYYEFTSDKYFTQKVVASATVYEGFALNGEGPCSALYVKYPVYYASGIINNWANESMGGSQNFNDVVKIIENCYPFIGYYTETGNDFRNSLIAFTGTESAANTWIRNHVTILSLSNNKCRIKIDLGADADKLCFVENVWSHVYDSSYQITGGQITGRTTKYSNTSMEFEVSLAT